MAAPADANEIKTDAGNAGAEHIESNYVGHKKQHEVILNSGYDQLGLWASVKRFQKAVLVCNLLCIAAAADGYQYTLNGKAAPRL